eukprot:11636799-Alexandrium_andersonii.AAC.1
MCPGGARAVILVGLPAAGAATACLQQSLTRLDARMLHVRLVAPGRTAIGEATRLFRNGGQTR